MRSLVKFLVLALIIVFLGLWIMTVAKSCEETDPNNLPDTETGIKDDVTVVSDDVEDLFEEDEGGAFNEEGDEIISNDTNSTIKMDEDEMEEEDAKEKAALEIERLAREEAAKKAGSAGNSGYNNMEYLIISGAFLTEVNAKREADKLKKLGYDDAEVVVFDFSQYHSVCADRSNSLSEARNLRNKLREAGFVEAYVHKKRQPQKK